MAQPQHTARNGASPGGRGECFCALDQFLELGVVADGLEVPAVINADVNVSSFVYRRPRLTDRVKLYYVACSPAPIRRAMIAPAAPFLTAVAHHIRERHFAIRIALVAENPSRRSVYVENSAL